MRKHRLVSADAKLVLQNTIRWNEDHVAALNSFEYKIIPKPQSSREL